jgi:MoaA/NifB/PqqE/SkfB family radical SAM enzyme
MQQIKNIKTVHIELTDKCQAQCPMCARNYYGGKTREFIKNNDISIDRFKEWFPKDFLLQLDNFYSCGNYGDPAFARDCLEIFQYVRECNSKTRLALHTNGGMRNSEWWNSLAKVLGKNSEVVFSVDGLKGKHELYRKNTKFDKVIENLKAFINAGGNARVDSLVFRHNENDVKELEKFLLDLGVQNINFFSTKRFYEMSKFEVHDNNGKIQYYLEPAETEQFKKTTSTELNKLIDKDFREQALETIIINPKCQTENEIYVDSSGNIFPCCWLGSEFVEHSIKEILPIHRLRNLSISFTKKMLDEIGTLNCADGVIKSNKILFEGLESYWQGKNKCLMCARQCSNIIYNLKSKYD